MCVKINVLYVQCAVYILHIYSRARKLFGHLNARRCDFNINIIIPTRKPPLSVSNQNKMQKLYILCKR